MAAAHRDVSTAESIRGNGGVGCVCHAEKPRNPDPISKGFDNETRKQPPGELSDQRDMQQLLFPALRKKSSLCGQGRLTGKRSFTPTIPEAKPVFPTDASEFFYL